MTSNTETGWGYIEEDEPNSVTSKYTFHWFWKDLESGMEIPISYNINSDVSIPSFHSKGAPDRKELTVTYIPEEGEPNGYNRFSGSIGNGRIYIKTKNLKIQGPIVGGPVEGQTFVGAGTWTRG
jgi:hypothetical protein